MARPRDPNVGPRANTGGGTPQPVQTQGGDIKAGPVSGPGGTWTLDPIRNHPDKIPTGSFYQGSGGNVVQQQPSDPMAEFLAHQQAEQAAREARIRQATQVLNEIFGRRSGQFDRFANETFAMNRDRLQEQQSEAARNLKFALARSGQMGGSVDVDKNAELEDRTNRGLVNARSYADEQAAQMRAQEQAAKNRLLGIASSGNVSSGDISGMAQDAMQSTQQAMENPPVQPGLGEVFAGLASTIGQALAAHGMRQGNQGVPGQQGFQSYFPNQRRNDQREEGTII